MNVPYEKAERKLGEARSKLLFARPYYAAGVYALRFVVTPEVPSLAVDERWRLYASPGWIERYDVGQIATGLCHELQHLLVDHAGRGRTVGVSYSLMSTWNDSADCDINDGLLIDCQTCKPLLPVLPEAWCLLPKHFGLPDGRLAEFYFARRMQERQERRSSGSGETKKNGGAGDGGRGQAGEGSGRGGQTSMPDFGCGSGSSGVPAPWDVGSPAESGVDGLDDADAWDIRRRVARDVKGHAERKGRGSVPGNVFDWAEELVRVKRISWEQLLTSALRRASQMTAGAVQHSYSRTSRRQHAFHPVIMPAYRRPVPNITLVTDTSLSMHEKLPLVRGVVDDVCRQLAVPLRVLDVDAAVHRDGLATRGSKVARVGGGGTDMRVGISAAMARPRPADSIVVCTDCETEWPKVRPKAHVIVVAVGATKEYLAAVPPWATTIEVEAA